MASDMYIWFEQPGAGAQPVEGETTDEQFKANKAIEIRSLSWGLYNPTDIGSATGGGGAAKVRFQSLNFTKAVDKSSTALQATCWSGGHYGLATLVMRRAGAEKQRVGSVFLKVKMKQVFVSNVQLGGSGDDNPTESVVLDFGAVEVEYTPQLPTGAPGAAKTMQWSQITNTKSF